MGFIATNISNRSRQLESNAVSPKMIKTQKDKPITDIDSDIDACQVALSPSVNLNRLKCSPDIPSVQISEKRSGSKKRLEKTFENINDEEHSEPNTGSNAEISEKNLSHNKSDN